MKYVVAGDLDLQNAILSALKENSEVINWKDPSFPFNVGGILVTKEVYLAHVVGSRVYALLGGTVPSLPFPDDDNQGKLSV